MNNDIEKRNDGGTQGQEGAILFVVMLLIIMFTGLGLLAMRHTRQELRSTGAYFDNMQAASLAESALAMAATDIKLSSDFYRAAFSSAEYSLLTADAGLEPDYEIPLNPEPGKREDGTHPILFDEVLGGYCAANVGTVPACVHQLSYPISGDTNFDDMMGVWARTTIKQTTPKVGPCPPGYSCSDEQNYGWYICTVDAASIYGQGGNGLSASVPSGFNYAQGRAQARGIMTVGPIGVFGQ